MIATKKEEPYVPEVVYQITVLVDGLDVFDSEYPDTTELVMDLHKAEEAVENAINETLEEEDFYD